MGLIVLTCEKKQVKLWDFLPLFDLEDLLVQVEWSEAQGLDETKTYLNRLKKGNKDQELQERNPDELERTMLVAMLERIYREESRNRWGIRAAQVLLEKRRELAAMREAESEEENLVVQQKSAEHLMQRLAEVWDEGGEGLMA